MAVAQAWAGEEGIKPLENLQQALALGKDTFTLGYIATGTTEACVEALKRFQALLREYRVPPANVRAIATSAVREASNSEAFLDRIYIATGMAVDLIDEAEVNRFTYLAVHPVLQTVPGLRDGETLVVEVGGGSTELLHMKQGNVVSAQGYRLGSLRLRKMVDEERAPAPRQGRILRSHVDRGVGQIRYSLPENQNAVMVALGGEARFAASQLEREWDKKGLVKIQVPALAKLTTELIGLSADDIVERFHVSFQDAETLGPALLVYTRLAEALDLRAITVSGVTLRDGVLAEMATHGSWTDEFKQQILSSVHELGKQYHVDVNHAEHVAYLSQQLFKAMKDEHRLDPRHELLLTVAALLHEVGAYVSTRSHHKHSMYLIMNSDIFGLGARDLQIVALVARYHRRTSPKASHVEYSVLDRESRVVVSKMAAILRIADALDRGHVQTQRDIDVSIRKGQCVIRVKQAGDFTLEQQGLREKAEMFEQVYGLKVVLEEMSDEVALGKG